MQRTDLGINSQNVQKSPDSKKLENFSDLIEVLTRQVENPPKSTFGIHQEW